MGDDIFGNWMNSCMELFLLFFQTTSLLIYPIFHYISMQSFVYHGAMVYLGIIINKYKYIEIEKKDILYYAGLILIICIIAYILNCIFDSNLMFISKDFPASPITILYRITGKAFPNSYDNRPNDFTVLCGIWHK